MTGVGLDVGERFPLDVLAERAGERVEPSALEGPAVVYFYPEAGTRGCEIEAKGFDALYDRFREVGVEVIGVSTDRDDALDEFASACRLRFPLVGDADAALTEQLGLIEDHGKHGRTAARVTFLVDGRGVVRQIWRVSDVRTHAEEVLAAALELADAETTAAGTA